MPTATFEQAITNGDIRRMTGAPGWLIREVLDRGTVAIPARVGLYRILTPAQLPAVLAALSKRGYPARCAHEKPPDALASVEGR